MTNNASNQKPEPDAYGRIIVNSDQLMELMYNGFEPKDLNIVYDETIEEYNTWCQKFYKLDHEISGVADIDHSPEEEHQKRSNTWFISDEFKDMDVRKILLEKCVRQDEIERVSMEMDMFEERNLINVLRLMFFLVDHFRKHNIVWGVGRGSSCASYCLFLIGLHHVDSIRFDLPITEFLK